MDCPGPPPTEIEESGQAQLGERVVCPRIRVRHRHTGGLRASCEQRREERRTAVAAQVGHPPEVDFEYLRVGAQGLAQPLGDALSVSGGDFPGEPYDDMTGTGDVVVDSVTSHEAPEAGEGVWHLGLQVRGGRLPTRLPGASDGGPRQGSCRPPRG